MPARTFIFSFLSLLAIATVCPAQTPSGSPVSPREQLNQYVADLQKNPSDDALRERIIKLALSLEPKPAIPEEAERRMVRGKAAVTDAKTPEDYKDAVVEFEKAALAAPWWASPYFGIAIVKDKLGEYGFAVRSLKLCLLAATDAAEVKDAKTLMYEVEYKQEKAQKQEELAQAESDKQAREAAAERSRRQAEAKARAESFEGVWYLVRDDGSVSQQAYRINRTPTGQYKATGWFADAQPRYAVVEGNTITWSEDWGTADRVMKLTLSENGSSLSGTNTWQCPTPAQRAKNKDFHYPRNACDMSDPRRTQNWTFYRR